MKRNLLFIFLCLVVGVSSVNAQCACSGAKMSVQKTCDKSSNAPQEAQLYKKYIKHVQQDRASVYNALNLSDAQIQKREDLMQEYNPLYEQKFDCLLKESFKLQAMQSSNAPETELASQRRVIKNIKKDIKKTLNKETKCFRKSLNGQQKAKYSMIKKLERRDFKRDLHQKDYYKSNPQMRPFGNPQPCPYPIGRE